MERIAAVLGGILVAGSFTGAASAGTVGYWRFESSGFLADSGPNGLTLSYTGTEPAAYTLSGSGAGSSYSNPIPQTGAPNTGAADFGLAQAGHFTRADAPALAFNSFTIETFVTRSGGITVPQYIASQWVTSGNQRGWTFGVGGTASAGSPSANELFVALSNNGTTNVLLGSGLTIPVSDSTDWYLAASVNIDNVAGASITFYAQNLTDGGPMLTSTVSSPIITSLFNSTAPLAIGTYNNDSARRWEGLIDEVRISNAALSADQLLIASAVPEPASAAALGLVAAAAGVRRRPRSAR